MADARVKRDRSPNFPCIPLKSAAERLATLEKYFGRHPAPLSKVGLGWGMKEGSDQATQMLSALRYYGLVDYQGNPPSRQVVITDAGRTYLRAQQDTVRQQVLSQAALRPRMIRKFWDMWGPDRPPDPICMDELVLRNGFSDRGAPIFLKIYDATIAFAGLARSDKLASEAEEELSENGNGQTAETDDPPSSHVESTPLRVAMGIAIVDGERELTTGLLSKDASFRLIVSGPIGVREIERLIKKLEFDKEILADEGEETTADEYGA